MLISKGVYILFSSSMTPNPIKMLIVKLEKVPRRTYSVVQTYLGLLRSPKRNMDLAASRNPIPSTCPV